MLEDSCVYSSVPAEGVTMAILGYASFHIADRKVKCFETLKRRFCRNIVQGSTVTTNVQSAVFRPCHRPTVVLPLVCCPVGNTFEVIPEIRCSGVSSRYCCCGNHTAGSMPI